MDQNNLEKRAEGMAPGVAVGCAAVLVCHPWIRRVGENQE